MKRALLRAPKDILIEDIKEPELKYGEALIEVASVGICAFDIKPYLGKELDLSPLPYCPGHEFGGIVKKIKDESEDIKVGDKVVVYPLINCENCFYCKNGLSFACENQKLIGSKSYPGGMAEKAAIPLKNLIKLPNNFDITYSSMIEPTAVAYHSVTHIKNSNVVLVGCGSIGLIILQILKINKNNVISIDIDESHLEIAKKLNTDFIINFKDKEKNKKIGDFLGENKVDFIILAYNNQQIIDWSIDILKKHGTIIVMATTEDILKINFNKIQINSVVIKGSDAYSIDEFKKALFLIKKGQILIKELVSKIFTLSEVKEAYEYKVNKNPLKILLIN